MRILFLCEGITIPASRYRVLQFLPYFKAQNIDSTVRFGYGDAYNQIAKTRAAPIYKTAMRAKRLLFAADADEFDVVFLQRPTFPQTAIGEELAHWLNPHTIFDFDDSLWLLGDGSTSDQRRSGFDRTVDIVKHVIAGNDFLADEVRHPQKTTVIPTVIDTELYHPLITRSDDTITIGWMGTSGNFPFLEKITSSLKSVLSRRSNVRLRLVSNALFTPLANVDGVEQIRWTAASEVSLLQSFDIGLMPLVDSVLTHGKCAFKMIQYMAVGIPVVVSDIGANRAVFGNVNPGFLLKDFDWEEALVALIDDVLLRNEMGRRGRSRAVSRYSIASVLPKYIEIFHQVAVKS